MEQDSEFEEEPVSRLFELAEEFVDLARRGACPNLEQFANRHADLRQEILELFPTLLALEEMKLAACRPSDGRITLGGSQVSHLGDFQVIREIGRGGMGIVFEALQVSLGRRVAVKMLPRKLVSDADISRFEQEARIAARLHHTNIVPVYGSGCHDGFYYFAMQLIEGRSLDQLLQQNQLPRFTQSNDFARWVARLGIQIASALDHAHKLHIIHRDVKLSNLIIDRHGTAWVTDFGLAHLTLPGTPDLDPAGGTRKYLAPEQLHGYCDARSDIYSLGVTLKKLLEEGLVLAAARGRSDGTSSRKTSSRKTRWKRDSGPPAELQEILTKATALSAENRYHHAGELAEDLQRFIEDRPILACRETRRRRLRKWIRRNPALAAACLLLCGMISSTILILTISYLNISHLNAHLENQNRRLAGTFFAFDTLLYSSSWANERDFGPRSLWMDQLENEEIPPPNSSGTESPPTDSTMRLNQVLPHLTTVEQAILDDPDQALVVIQMRQRVGRWLRFTGHLEEAERAFFYAKEVDSQGAFSKESRQNHLAETDLIQKIRVDNDLSIVYDFQFRFPQAQRLREQSLRHFEQIGRISDSESIVYDMALATYGLAKQQKVLEPLHLFRKCLMKGTPEHRTPEHRTSSQTSLEQTKSQQLNRAIELARKSVQLDNRKVSRSLLLAESLFERAASSREFQPHSSKDLDEALGLLHQLRDQYPENLTIRSGCVRILAHCPTMLDEKSTEVNHWVFKQLQEASHLAEETLRLHPEMTELLGYQAIAQYKIGLLLHHKQNPVAALPHLKQSVAILNDLTGQLPKDVRYRIWCALSQTSLALNLKQLGHNKQSWDLYADALKQFEKFHPGIKSNSSVQDAEEMVRQCGDHWTGSGLQEQKSG